MFSIDFEKYTLSNGLQVILHEDHALPITAVNLWYHVGSKNEEAGRTGFAHMFEHVMFEGSKNHNKLFFEPLQKVGANLNGSTGSDSTNYWATVPSNYLELVLWLESDRMGFLLDALDQKRFDVQRDVVKNERRQSYENRPYGMAHLLLQPTLYPTPHPYSWPVIGSQEDLDAAELDDIKDFFRTYYSPSNASLSIAGDIDRDATRGLIEKYFAEIPPAPAINRVGRMDSSLKGEVRMDLRDKVQLPRLSLVWPSGPMFHADEAPLDILAAVLGDGKSSRLYNTLVYDKQVARDVRVGSYAQEIAGEFEIQVTANPGNALEEIEDLVDAEVDRLRHDAPTDHEIERAINRIESHHVRNLERVGGFGGRADQLNHYNVFSGDPGLVNTDIERYRKVFGADTVRVANEVLGDNRVRLAVLPAQEASPSGGEVDRSQMPKAADAGVYTPPIPQRAELDNGLKVMYVEKPGLPVVAVGLVLHGGSASDPIDRPGLDHMTATMLSEGTKTRTSQQIAEELEFLGSELEIDANREHVLVGAEALTSHWPAALEILSDVVRNPTFPDRDLERVRSERLADLSRIGDDPVAIAHRAARALLYGPETSYGHPGIGTDASVQAFTREELATHYQSCYGPNNATLLVVGDVSRDSILSKAEAQLGDWATPASGPSKGAGGTESSPAPATIYLADKPGAPQSVIRAGHLTIARGDPDFYEMMLINYLFGGHPTARLFMNLRQDKGYSYGYYSSIDWLKGPSAIFAGGSVETSVTKESVVETLKEFAGIRGESPVTEDEYNDARDGLFRGFPSQFETQGQLLHQLGRQVVFGLQDDYYSRLLSRLDAVTLDRMHEVAAARIDDAHLSVLVVGDKKAIEPGLRDLGLPIVEVDSEGRAI